MPVFLFTRSQGHLGHLPRGYAGARSLLSVVVTQYGISTMLR